MRPPQRPNTSHAMTSVLFTVILFVGWTITSQFGMVSRKARNVHETSAPSLARSAGRFRGRGGRDAGILGFWSNRTTGLRSYRKAWLRPRSRTACFGLFAPTSAPALLAASPLSLQAHDQKFTIQATIFQLSNRTKSYAPSALTIPPYASNLDRSVRFVCIDCGKETFS